MAILQIAPIPTPIIIPFNIFLMVGWSRMFRASINNTSKIAKERSSFVSVSIA